MKIGIIYDSKTGNTKEIAKVIKEACEQEEVIMFNSVEEALEVNSCEDIDLYFLGSWTDKGTCGELMKQYCNNLNHKKVAIFGTAGFGGSEEYYESLANRFSSSLPETNTILGTFYCQGKMPIGIRNRYVSMLEKSPDDKKLIINIENFDDGQSHPDMEDLINARAFAKKILGKI